MFLSKAQLNLVRQHLTSILHKYSDADANILSDYIVALLSKEGSESQLRNDCESELSAFMNQKTKQFVDKLFHFIIHNIKQNANGNSSTANNANGVKHTRKVELSSNSQRPAVTINTNNAETSTAAKIGGGTEQETDFAVSSTPTPPNDRNAANNGPDKRESAPPQQAPSGATKYHHHHRNRRRTHHATAPTLPLQHTTTTTNNNNNQNPSTATVSALHQLLGIVQQNIQHVQAQQYQNPSKAFTTRRLMQNRGAMPPINPAMVTTQYVARPIIQHTPNVQNFAANAQKASKPASGNTRGHGRGQGNGQAKAAEKQNGASILDHALDEIRLPPPNNPFYHDDRFNAAANSQSEDTKTQSHHHHQQHHSGNRFIGKKRNFSKMNNHQQANQEDANQHKKGNTKFSTPMNEKRQLYVYNIPPRFNTMNLLASHFEQFGDIQHIQVHRDSNKAYVQFSSHEEALEALNFPEDILGVNGIQTRWAHYNRRDFERNAKHSNSSNTNNGNGHHQQQQQSSLSPHHQPQRTQASGDVSHQWVSKEYKDKIVHPTSPPTKKQKVGNTEKKTVKIPKDVSENIEKLKARLQETLKMYEVLEADDDKDNEDKKDLKNTLKKTIDNIEVQMKKLLDHQRKRQDLLKQVENESASAAASKSSSPSRFFSRPRMRGRGRGYRGGGPSYRGRRGGFAPYSAMYHPHAMMRGNPMYWRGGPRMRSKYRVIRKPTSFKNANKTKKADLSGKSVDYRSSSLMIENLPQKVDEAELRVHFQKFGDVNSIDLLSNNTGKVRFKKRSDAEKALLNGRKFETKSEHISLKLFFENTENNVVNHHEKDENETSNDDKQDENIYDDLNTKA